MKIVERSFCQFKYGCFLIMLLSFSFAMNAQDETEKKWQYELGMGLSTGLSDEKGLINLPIFANVNYQLGRSEKLGFEFDYQPMIQSGFSGSSFYENFSKMSFQYLRRIRYWDRNRWVGFGIQTGSSKTISDFSKRKYGYKSSPIERFFTVPTAGIQLKWQEYFNNFFYAFEISHFFVEVGNIPPTFAFDENPLFFTHKIGFKFPKNKRTSINGDELILIDNPIDSFYNKWNFSAGVMVKVAFDNEIGSAVLPFFVEGNYRTGKFVYGMQFDAKEGYNAINDGDEQIKTVISTYFLNSFGLIANRYFQKSEMEYFLGLKVGIYDLRGSYPFWESDLNVGYAWRVGYQMGRFRHTLSYNYTGDGIPNYLSSSIGINLGFSKYYRY